MPNLKEVKTRISSVISTQQITKAMKLVAAAKLRKAQDRVLQLRPYAEKLGEILQNVAAIETDTDLSTFSEEREVGKVLIIAVASDRGLCGAFNSNVFRASAELIDQKYSRFQRSGDLTVLPIGKRSYDYFRKRDYQIIDSYHELFHDLDFQNAGKVVDFVMKEYEKGEYDRVEIVYNEFKNVATQILRVEQFLPIQIPEADGTFVKSDYLFEPVQDDILQLMIPKALKTQFFKSVLESNAAEHGARMTAMDKATENADELLADLRLTYNRTRQAAITKEILEIVAGAEALSG